MVPDKQFCILTTLVLLCSILLSPLSAQQPSLHWAAERGKKELVDSLLTEGADLNGLDRHGYTPLHLAAEHGRLEVAELLIDRGAVIDTLSSSGQETPLHMAALHNYHEMVSLLLSKGADANFTIRQGRTTLHHLATMTGVRESIDALIAHGADMNGTDDNGAIPLHWAALESRMELIALFLEKGADIGANDAECVPLRMGQNRYILASVEKGHTPLHWAAGGTGTKRVIEYLVANGADVHARTSRLGRVPLHIAAILGKSSMIEGLVEAGADVNVTDTEGRTPLDLAKKELTKATLLKFGAKSFQE